MAKIKINKLPKGFKLVNDKIVEDQFMRDGGDLRTGDQADYGLVTTPQEYYGNTNFNNTDDVSVRYSLSAVPRDKANIEAEGGETVLTDLTNDGTFGLYNINGPRHKKGKNGGVPMFLPEQSFIYSDTEKMKFTKEELADFGVYSKKKMTPAKLSKKYQLNEHYASLQSPYADNIQATTAELMLKKNMMNLSKVAFGQESKKKFEDGVPLASHPYLVQQGIDPIEFTAKMEEITIQEAQMKAMAALPPEQLEQMLQMQQMMAQMEAQQQGQQPMQEQGVDQEMMMQEQAMARFGGERPLRKAQTGNGEDASGYRLIDPNTGKYEVNAEEIDDASIERTVNIGGEDNVEVLETVITEQPTASTGNPGISAEQWAIWKPYIDKGATLETIDLGNGQFTVKISTPKSDVQKLRDDIQATNLVGSGGTIDIYGEDISGQRRAIEESASDGYYYKQGPLVGERTVGQDGVDGVYGSADINSDRSQTIFRDNWDDVLVKIEEQFGVPFDRTNKEQVLAFQTAAEEQRKLDAEAAGVPYISYFKKPGDPGYVSGEGFDGLMGLHTINASRLIKDDTFSDEATYGDIKKKVIEQKIPEEYNTPDPEFWLQDQNNLIALGQIDDNLYLPWAPDAERVQLAPTFDDWRAQVNANNASASTMAQALGAAGGPQAIARSNIQGKTLDANAKAINQVNTNNVGISNQYGDRQAQYDIANNQENARRQMGVYDNTQKVLQEHDNFKNRKVGENLRLQNAALTNRANTANLNTTYDNYAVNPTTGGMIGFTNPNALKKVGDKGDALEAYYDQVLDYERQTGNVMPDALVKALYPGQAASSNGYTSRVASELKQKGAAGRVTAGKGKEIKRMVVPFYTGKMGR